MAKKGRAKTVATATVEAPEETKAAQVGNLAVDLGIPGLVEFEHLGYIPHFADVKLTQPAREAVKRLSVTLDQNGARLSDGSLVKSSVPKTITWLCERLADAT